MDINSWLTVITIFTALFAILPKEELFLRFHRVSKIEISIWVAINIIAIPYLIFFPVLLKRFSFLESFTYPGGVASENIAFALFYISFLWLLYRLVINSKIDASSKVISFLKGALIDKPFPVFFKLFHKYTSFKIIDTNWDSYKEIVLHQKFLQGIIETNPDYLLQFWKNLDNEQDFQAIFRLFLNDLKSPYYSEVKANWNSYNLLIDKPFLTCVLKENINQSIHNGVFLVLTDHITSHLLAEQDKYSRYNQLKIHPRLSENEGFELPMYYHIRFVGLLYSSAIENQIDISRISTRYTNMQSIYSNIVKLMINNIVINQDNRNQPYPTNYHWLIKEIFDLQGNWLSSFGLDRDKSLVHFDEDSSYIHFIPNSISNCLSELYDGYNRGKVTLEFINQLIYFYLLQHYFDYHLPVSLKVSIENEVLLEMPNSQIEDIIGYALNERFALDYSNFISKNFRLCKTYEKEILLRLLNFLKDKTKI